MSRSSKFLPTLTEVLANVGLSPQPKARDVTASPPDFAESAQVLSAPEVAQIEQQLAHSHWLEQHLAPALKEWVELEVSKQIAAQMDRLAPEWARVLSDAVTNEVIARVPAIVDRLVDANALAPPTPRV